MSGRRVGIRTSRVNGVTTDFSSLSQRQKKKKEEEKMMMRFGEVDDVMMMMNQQRLCYYNLMHRFHHHLTVVVVAAAAWVLSLEMWQREKRYDGNGGRNRQYRRRHRLHCYLKYERIYSCLRYLKKQPLTKKRKKKR